MESVSNVDLETKKRKRRNGYIILTILIIVGIPASEFIFGWIINLIKCIYDKINK